MGGVHIDFGIPELNHIIHFFRHTMIGRLPAESNKNICILVGSFRKVGKNLKKSDKRIVCDPCLLQ